MYITAAEVPADHYFRIVQAVGNVSKLRQGHRGGATVTQDGNRKVIRAGEEWRLIVLYLQDLGLVKLEIAKIEEDPSITEEGIALMWQAYYLNPNSSFTFRKLVTGLSREGRYEEIAKATKILRQYKINLEDSFVQRLLGMSP